MHNTSQRQLQCGEGGGVVNGISDTLSLVLQTVYTYNKEKSSEVLGILRQDKFRPVVSVRLHYHALRIKLKSIANDCLYNCSLM